MTSRVLLADTDLRVIVTLSRALLQNGFSVVRATSKSEALEKLTKERQVLSCGIVDVHLPGEDWPFILPRLRAKRIRVPVLLLSATPSEDEVVQAFQAGADDYVSKPFRVREVVARVRRLARTQAERAPNILGPGGCSIDPLTRELRWADGNLRLGARECEIMEALFQADGAVPWSFFIEHESEQADTVRVRALYERVRRLRARLRTVGAPIDVLVVRGVGCQVVAAPQL